MKLNPYLNFPGTCREAFTFYQEVLGGEITAMMPHAGTPMEEHAGPEWKDKIIHACLVVDGQVLMASDVPPQMMQSRPQGFSVTVTVEDTAEAERIYEAFREGAQSVDMEIQETFWAHRFAMVTDRFGTPWMITCNKPMG